MLISFFFFSAFFCGVQMFRPMEETKCSFIDTLEELVALNETLCKVSEFAVDLEVRVQKVSRSAARPSDRTSIDMSQGSRMRLVH